MGNYDYTHAYKSVLGKGFFETAKEAKLADLGEAARVLQEQGLVGVVGQIQRREGPAYDAVKALAELYADDETLTDELAAKRQAAREEWWRNYQAKKALGDVAEAAGAAIADAAE